MAFTFGSTPAASTAAPLFGSTATTSAAPLFGATTTTAAAPTSAPLFGAATTTSTAAPLFGAATTSTATGGLLGGTPAKTSTAPSLFGATTTTTAAAPAAGGLFGATTTTAPATGGLFGATATSAAPAAGGLFGATAAKPAASGGLFGSTTTTTPATGLFGAATTAAPAAAAPSVGLGGSASAVNSALNPGGAGTTLGAPTVEKENVREGEVPKPIMELLQQAKAKIKENKSNSDTFAAASSDGGVRIKDRLQEVNTMIRDGVSAMALGDSDTARLSARVQRDLRLGKEAQAVQEAMARNPHGGAFNQHTVQHMIGLIQEYDEVVNHYQEVVEQLTVRMRDILQGKNQMTTDELKEYLTRFDVIFSAVANKLFEANSKVQELKAALAVDGQIQLREAVSEQPQSWWQMKGPAAFPTHSTLLQIGAMLKPAAGAPGTTATTGTGLFGSTGTTGGSLFGSTTAAKPSLFGSTTTSATGGSLFPPLTTSTSQSTSLFPSVATAKPATSFGSTLSTGTTGLLFSSKK